MVGHPWWLEFRPQILKVLIKTIVNNMFTYGYLLYIQRHAQKFEIYLLWCNIYRTANEKDSLRKIMPF